MTSKGWVYILSENTKYYKIGHTHSDPKNRIADLQTGNPRELKLLIKIETEFPDALEARLHTKFANKCERNEWFILDDKDLDELKLLEASNDSQDQCSVVRNPSNHVRSIQRGHCDFSYDRRENVSKQRSPFDSSRYQPIQSNECSEHKVGVSPNAWQKR